MPYYLTIQSRGTVALPPDVRARHHLDEPGAQVRVVERADGVIELHPMIARPASQSWFWTERWQQMEREVDEHIAAGRVVRSDSAEEFLAELDGTLPEHA